MHAPPATQRFSYRTPSRRTPRPRTARRTSRASRTRGAPAPPAVLGSAALRVAVLRVGRQATVRDRHGGLWAAAADAARPGRARRATREGHLLRGAGTVTAADCREAAAALLPRDAPAGHDATCAPMRSRWRHRPGAQPELADGGNGRGLNSTLHTLRRDRRRWSGGGARGRRRPARSAPSTCHVARAWPQSATAWHASGAFAASLCSP